MAAREAPAQRGGESMVMLGPHALETQLEHPVEQRADLLGAHALLRKLQVAMHLAEQRHFRHEGEGVVGELDLAFDLGVVGVHQRHLQLERHAPVARAARLVERAVQQLAQRRAVRQRQVGRHRPAGVAVDRQLGVVLHVGNGGDNAMRMSGCCRCKRRTASMMK